MSYFLYLLVYVDVSNRGLLCTSQFLLSCILPPLKVCRNIFETSYIYVFSLVPKLNFENTEFLLPACIHFFFFFPNKHRKFKITICKLSVMVDICLYLWLIVWARSKVKIVSHRCKMIHVLLLNIKMLIFFYVWCLFFIEGNAKLFFFILKL